MTTQKKVFESTYNLDFKNIDTISSANDGDLKAVLAVMAGANRQCWDAMSKYKFKGPSQPSLPNGQDLHFLMNGGTQALIQNINVLKQAIGAGKLSFFMGSYGTAVAGAFATTFFNFVDKFVLNSPISPYEDSPKFIFEDSAAGKQAGVDYVLATCHNQLDSECLLKSFATNQKDLATIIMEAQTAFLPCENKVVMFPSVTELQNRTNALSAAPACDAACKDIYSLFPANASDVAALAAKEGLYALAVSSSKPGR
jgi:hypothetical protein